MRLSSCAGALISALLFACAAPTTVVTNRAHDYKGKPAKLYVVHFKGLGFDTEFSNSFRKNFAEIAKQCGVTTVFGEVNGMELDDNAIVADMKKSQADSILAIAIAGGVVDPLGARISVKYDARLDDVKLKRIVWRGNFNFSRGGTMIPLAERGATLAVDVTNSLKRDTLFTGCPELEAPPQTGKPAAQPATSEPGPT